MNFNVNRVKIFITVPVENVNQVREAVCNAGAGIIGEYEATDTLYNIFEEIFLNESELENFLSNYN